ncbi:MAG: zinc dependent phospholipase C family protein [Lachnospiraceae bacterium]|nr:zinc dependent phospholipase C family protein [Lachnospiraceae bacterium]MBQ2981598.1 zinc dependent phospholipase C family protein [Lachnospiraceae bacterium]
MPGYDMHYLFGIHSYRKMTEDTIVKKAVRNNPGSYKLGLLGPDIFFYYATEVVAARKNIGSLMHTTKTDIFLKNMIYYIDLHKGKAREVGIAYLSGFLSHYVVDCLCHPYVYWMTDYLHKEINYLEKHFRFESDMDIALLAMYKNTTPYEFMKNSSFNLNQMETAVVCDMLYYAIRSTYHDSRITRSGIQMAIYSLYKEQRLIRIASEKANRALGKVSKLLGNKRYLASFIPSDKEVRYEDPLNLKHRKWHNPWDVSRISTDSVPELLGKGDRRFSLMMFLLDNYLSPDTNKAAAYKTLVAFIGCKSYHSGLNCRIQS